MDVELIHLIGNFFVTRYRLIELLDKDIFDDLSNYSHKFNPENIETALQELYSLRLTLSSIKSELWDIVGCMDDVSPRFEDE